MWLELWNKFEQYNDAIETNITIEKNIWCKKAWIYLDPPNFNDVIFTFSDKAFQNNLFPQSDSHTIIIQHFKDIIHHPNIMLILLVCNILDIIRLNVHFPIFWWFEFVWVIFY